MAKGVFTTKVNPTYDDLPEVRYHFPKTYLHQAQATVGDWIVYYEPRRQGANAAGRGGRQIYFATARVQRIADDPHRHAHYYAFVKDFLEFEPIVPFRQDGKYLNDHNGPDSMRNGIALSQSIHWMFDRGLLALADGYEILMVKDLIPEPVKSTPQSRGQNFTSCRSKAVSTSAVLALSSRTNLQRLKMVKGIEHIGSTLIAKHVSGLALRAHADG